VELFAAPLAENVSMLPKEETDREKAAACLREAGLDKKLDGLKYGLDTELLKIASEEGIDLSGGEKQKLALARALYKDAPVVVLDEPTAALDALAEKQLYERFDRLIGKKSAVYISHRLASTRFCDRIAMFMDGRMVEYGSHDELMEKGGEYARLFDVQAQCYREHPEGEEAAE
jgi:ABC-type multidrug transport system fused ATPase/permease subunit